MELIRGAAGSGKTTTALLKLKSLIGFFASRRKRENDTSPIRVLVLTYNRTLRGYIEALTQQQASTFEGVNLEVETFGHWAKRALADPSILDDKVRENKILTLGSHLQLPSDFLLAETEYVLGRFLPADLGNYVSARRDGRGASPRMDKTQRQALLDDVITPYEVWKLGRNRVDWNDLAVQLAAQSKAGPYDVIIADESQDFSANQVRALIKQLSPVHCMTFVLDSVQRIYARGRSKRNRRDRDCD